MHPKRLFAILGILCSCATGNPFVRAQASANTTLRSLPKTAIEIGPFEPDGLGVTFTQFVAHVAAGEKTVVFNINSPGGSVFAGLSFVKAVEDVKKNTGVHTICIVDTHAYSMGFITLQSGVCDERYATERATLSTHNAAGQAEGTAHDLEETAKKLRTISTAMARMCAARMHMPLDAYLAKIEGADWMMTAEEALAAGAIDGVVSSSSLPPRE